MDIPATSDNIPGTLVLRDAGGAFSARSLIVNGSGDVIFGAPDIVNVGSGVQDGATFFNFSALHISRSGGSPLFLRRRDTDGNITNFYRDTTLVGSVSITTTATSYNISSDYRLKENIEPMTGGLTKLMSLNPKTFEFKVEPGIKVDGFIAHEVQTVIPQAVTGEKDGEEMQGLDMSKLVPVLVAAVQELTAKVEALEEAQTQ